MTATIRDEYRKTLSQYSPRLLEASANRTARFARSKKITDPAERIERALESKRMVARLAGNLEPTALQILNILRRCPAMYWRWDHATRLLVACGIESPYRVLQLLLSEGLLCMRTRPGSDPLEGFQVTEGIPCSALPHIALAAPLLELPLQELTSVSPLEGRRTQKPWRSSDGWELPVRLAILWRLAWNSPFKWTQQDMLFKRDLQRLTNSPTLNTSMVDEPLPIEDLGLFIHALAMNQGWLKVVQQRGPQSSLSALWPADLWELLLWCGRQILTIEIWNELGSKTPVGNFASEVASARFLLLLWLSTLEPEHGATIEQLTKRLEQTHSPWNATGELVGPFRKGPKRSELALEWVRRFLLGPMYQCGFVCIAPYSGQSQLVRLSPLGQKFLGESGELEAPPDYPHSLLAQPNHEIIVYRQGLSVPLLYSLMQFAEPKSVGAALTLELNPESVYRGLEVGMTPEQMIELLQKYSGQKLAVSLAASIKTWAQKRDRLCVYSKISLFEFENENDLAEAVQRGLEGVRITDRILLVTSKPDKSFRNVRISSSRDYRFASEKCVEVGPDGITLKIDLQKSDLMLEAELKRFAEPLPSGNPDSGLRYRVTANSLNRAFGEGLGIQFLEEWFRHRTGQSPPASVLLLLRASDGLVLSSSKLLVVSVENPILADGLEQHPLTAGLFEQRVGSCVLSFPEEKLDELRRVLSELGIKLQFEV